jgi:hypothetical protein
MHIENVNSYYKISQLKKDILELQNNPFLYYYEITPKIFDDNFAFDFDYILFKNFYTASINILQFHDRKWKTILNEFTLMTDPDSDEEGEKYFLLEKGNFENFNIHATIMRIYLTQECTDWKSFCLSEIKFLKEKFIQDSSNESNSQLGRNHLKYDQSNSTFQIGKFIILHDKEDINRKYLEINNLDYKQTNLHLLK